MSGSLSELSLDKSAFSAVKLADSDDDRFYWLSKTAAERFQHMQTLRLINYGNAASARLQRVLEIAQREAG